VSSFGAACLVIAAVACVAGFIISIAAAVSPRPRLERFAAWSTYSVLLFALLACAALLYALLARDFSVQAVYEVTSRDLPVVYTITALWASGAGSLLLWFFLLTLLSVVAIRRSMAKGRTYAAQMNAILLAVCLFFALLLLFAPDLRPFARVATTAVPVDGLGLKPMLQHPGMIFHPVALYLGYVGMAIPFALGMAGLLAGGRDEEWVRALRRWALFGWFFLTIGNILGAWWSYVTLGWGGYWAWDPVENASLMPWLTGTALVHSLAMMRRRKLFGGWSMALIVVTFCLTIFGAFLTRSGVVTSIHAFSGRTLVPWFAAFLGAIVVFSLVVLILRRGTVRHVRRSGGAVWHERSFFATNIIFVVIAFAVFWGVALYPAFASAVQGREVQLTPSFFNGVAAPLGLVLMFLIALCPLLIAGRIRDRRGVDWMIAGGVGIVLLAGLAIAGVRNGFALIAFFLAGVAVPSLVLQYYGGYRTELLRSASAGKGAVAGALTSFGSVVWRNRPRYGGLIVHLGIVMVLVGITGSQVYKQVAQQKLAPGGSLSLGSYELVFEGLSQPVTAATNKQQVGADLVLSRGGKELGRLRPVHEYYPASDTTWTRVARRSTVGGDVYVTLLEYSDDGSAVIQAQLNPLVGWLWIGGFVMAFGGLIALWPRAAAGQVGREGTEVASAGPAIAGTADVAGDIRGLTGPSRAPGGTQAKPAGRPAGRRRRR
jgi:cytochrome c-type biogenesis protein CcmF